MKKNKLILLLLLLVSSIASRAQSALETLLEIKGNPEYVLCSAKNAMPEKARSMCLSKLVLELNEISSDAITQEQVLPIVKELSVKNGDITEIYMYVRKSDIGSAAAQPAETKTQGEKPANATPATPSGNSDVMPGATSVSFKFTDDWAYNDQLRAKLENNISRLLTAINTAVMNKRTPDFSGIAMDEGAKDGLQTCLKELPYYCKEAVNIGRCMKTSTEYLVQDIPVYSYKHPEHDKNIRITFDGNGLITCVRFAAELESYEKIMKKGGQEITDATDVACRTSILSFVENYRNYYINKDIAKIENVFADDAIIITGTIVTKVERKKGDTAPTLKPTVKYDKRNKEEYIKSLKGIFGRNESILVLFDDIKVIRHPKRPQLYGVTLKQSWTSRRKDGREYSDVGHVFLLWDFQDPENPKIHIRTWQPDEAISKPEDVFGLASFRY